MSVLSDKLDGFGTIEEILAYVAPFQFDDGSSIISVALGDVEFVREHYRTLIDALDQTEQISFLEQFYLTQLDINTALDERITALENA